MEDSWFREPLPNAFDAVFPMTVQGFNYFRDSEMPIDEELSTIIYDGEEDLRIEYNYWKNPIFAQKYIYGTIKTWNSMFPSSLLLRLMRSMCYTDYMALNPSREIMPHTTPINDLQWNFIMMAMFKTSWWTKELVKRKRGERVVYGESMPEGWKSAITKALWGGSNFSPEDSMYMRATDEQREAMDEISEHFWSIHNLMIGSAYSKDYGILNFTTDDEEPLEHPQGREYDFLSSKTHFDVEHEFSHKTLRDEIKKLEYPQVFSWWNDGRVD